MYEIELDDKIQKHFWLHCACLDSFCQLTQIQSREDLYVVYIVHRKLSRDSREMQNCTAIKEREKAPEYCARQIK